ncbi:unnamed protein product [Lactuca saligna]|uniref:Geranylgeranyl reductase n=1 Tax=Lactuca saligna TaxID=75948 RepID=A0AA35Y003_LACSI|nr:unnamed protein product [Lactuca saligna]
MCAEAIVEGSENGRRMVDEGDLRSYLKKWDKTYWSTYKVLDVLQKVFYRSNPAKEAFVEMCSNEYVQKMTFDSYLYKKVAPGNPLEDLKLAVNTIGSLVRAHALNNEMTPLVGYYLVPVDFHYDNVNIKKHSHCLKNRIVGMIVEKSEGRRKHI